MLQPLYQWRAQCTPQQLADFETALAPLGKDAIRYQTVHKRYHGSYHCALISQPILLAAIQTSFKQISGWEHTIESGERLVRGLAARNGIAQSLLQNSGWMSGNPTLSPFSEWNEVHGGSMERNSSSEMGQSGEADRRSRLLQEPLQLPSSSEQADAVLCMLKERGIVFEYDGHVCLPAEFVLMLKQNKDPQGWIALCAKLPNAILRHLVPDTMESVGHGNPVHNEMAAWLICKGVDAQQQIPRWQGLDETDESFLFYLDIHGSIASVKILQQFCHDAIEVKPLHERQTISYQFSRTPLKSALQSSLEEHVPTRLKKYATWG